MQIPLFKFRESKASFAPLNRSSGLWLHFYQLLAEKERIPRPGEPENCVISLPRLGFLRWLNLTTGKGGKAEVHRQLQYQLLLWLPVCNPNTAPQLFNRAPRQHCHASAETPAPAGKLCSTVTTAQQALGSPRNSPGAGCREDTRRGKDHLCTWGVFVGIYIYV